MKDKKAQSLKRELCQAIKRRDLPEIKRLIVKECVDPYDMYGGKHLINYAGGALAIRIGFYAIVHHFRR